MKHWRSGLTLALAGISVVPVLHEAISATYTASPTVSVPTSCSPGPGDLQSCLDIAADDPQADIILLQPGTYTAGPYFYLPGIDDDGGALVLQNETATLPILDSGGTVSCLDIDTTDLPSDLGADFTASGIVFQNCTNNNAGGALQINTNQANITLDNTDFFGNTTTDDDGGGASLNSDSGNITIRDSLFEDNSTTSEEGGGLHANSNSGNVDLLNNVFNQNMADNDGGGADIFCSSGNITVQGNSFTGNEGGITDQGQGGGASVSGDSGNILVSNNLFTGNKSHSNGGGLSVGNNNDESGSITIVNNIFSGNSNGNSPTSTNTFGGGFYLSDVGGDLILTNNTIFGNTSQASDNLADGGGIAIFLDPNSTGEIYNNIIFGNTAEGDGGDIYSDEDAFDTGGGTLNLFNNDFSSLFSEALDNGGAGTVNQGSNLDLDPLFVNAAGGNFNLTAASPVIDMGDPAAPGMPSTDFAGNPRPANPGTNPDMGAFEFQPVPTPSPTPSPTAIPLPFLLQGDGCSLHAGAAAIPVWSAWAGLLVLAAAASLRRLK